MKKIFKKEVIIAFIIGLLIASSIAVYAYSYMASDIGYTKPGTTQAISVETALNDLYNNKNATLLWTNSSPTSNFNAQTISLDLSEYQYIFVVTRTSTELDDTHRTIGLFNVLDDVPTLPAKIACTGGSATRQVYATSTGVTFSNATFTGGSQNNSSVIPLYIYGIKNNLGI